MDFSGFDIMTLLTPQNVIFIFLGTFIGLLVGAMPGMGTNLAIVLMLPLSFTLNPLTAILLLLCVYQSAEYGGSIAGITLGIPGTASAAASLIDGNAMAKNGEPGKALRFSLLASTIGGIFGGLVLMFLTRPVGQFSLKFSAPDFFMLGVTAVIAVISLNSKSMVKGLISVVLGLMLSTVGTDSFTGTARYTLGRTELLEGVYMVGLAVAVFAVPEVIDIIINSLHTRYVSNTKNIKAKLTAKERNVITKPTAIGSVLGCIVGIFPGLGGAVASWLSLLVAQKTSKSPETFGKGNPEGIVAPEAANNACVAGSMVPMLALGIPGSGAAAIIGAAFIVHGIQVGPTIFKTDPGLLSGIYIGFLLSPIAMYILGRLLTPFFARVLTIPNAILLPILIFLIITGTYAGKTYFFHLGFALILGVLLYFLKKASFPLAPIMISFVLGPTIEVNFRRSFELSGGKINIFWMTTSSKVILAILLVVVFFPLIKKLVAYMRRKRAGANGAFLPLDAADDD